MSAADDVTVPRWALECLLNQPMWLSISDEMESAALALKRALMSGGYSVSYWDGSWGWFVSISHWGMIEIETF